METEIFAVVLHQEGGDAERLEQVCEKLIGVAAHLHVEKFPVFGSMPMPNKIGHDSLTRAINTKATHVLFVLSDYMPCDDFDVELERVIQARPEDILCLTGVPNDIFLPGLYTSADGLVPFCCLPIDVARDFLAFCHEALNDFGWCGTIDENLVTYAQMVGVPIYRAVIGLTAGNSNLETDWTQPPQAFVGRETPTRHWRLITCLRPAFRRVRLAYDLERVKPVLGDRLQAIMDKAKKQNAAVPFAAPESMMPHIRSVLQGEYDFPLLRLESPSILDIGANLGAFALWAKKRFPGCSLHCYEPHPDNFKLLKHNVEQYEIPAELHEVAVSLSSGKLKLYDGKNNCGEASLFHGDEQASTSHEVASMPPEELPAADFIKIDTEGAEYEIIFGYPFWGAVKAVVLEWHSPRDRDRIKSFLTEGGFTLAKDEVTSEERGVMGFVRAAP